MTTTDPKYRTTVYIEPDLKRELHAALVRKGESISGWFRRKAVEEIQETRVQYKINELAERIETLEHELDITREQRDKFELVAKRLFLEHTQ